MSGIFLAIVSSISFSDTEAIHLRENSGNMKMINGNNTSLPSSNNC